MTGTDTIQSVSVILPTLRRPKFLTLCLASLAKQTTLPTEVLVAIVSDDKESEAVVAEWEGRLRLRVIRPGGRGVIGAMNACLAAAVGDGIVLLDDDVELPPDWLERMLGFLNSNTMVAGAGGRDLLLDHPEMRAAERLVSNVGVVEPWGRIVGNHHRGAPPMRPVRFLRGSNCLYRGDFLRATRFDERLRGDGAQVHWELALGFCAWNAGLTLLYVPELVVAHHVAPRQDGDGNHRGVFNARGVQDMIYNEVSILLRHARGWVRVRCLLWNFLVGSLTCPGVIQIPRLLVKHPHTLLPRIRAAWQGRFAALADSPQLHAEE